MDFSRRLRFRGEAGFGLVEAAIATALIAIALGSAIVALVVMNRHADITRLYTCASTVMQNQIDRVLSNQYIPQENYVPPELVTGTTVQNNVPVYIDPATNQTIVTGTMTTVVTATGTTRNGASLNLVRVNVTLTYPYMGKTYTQTLHTLRTSDL